MPGRTVGKLSVRSPAPVSLELAAAVAVAAVAAAVVVAAVAVVAVVAVAAAVATGTRMGTAAFVFSIGGLLTAMLGTRQSSNDRTRLTLRAKFCGRCSASGVSVVSMTAWPPTQKFVTLTRAPLSRASRTEVRRA